MDRSGIAVEDEIVIALCGDGGLGELPHDRVGRELAAGVSVRSLYTWRQSSEFSDLVRDVRSQIYADARNALQGAAGEAVRALRDVVTDKESAETVRVRAALGILDHASRTWEIDEVDRRLKDLEQGLERPS